VLLQRQIIKNPTPTPSTSLRTGLTLPLRDYVAIVIAREWNDRSNLTRLRETKEIAALPPVARNDRMGLRHSLCRGGNFVDFSHFRRGFSNSSAFKGEVRRGMG
jgi:hypothetical protein